MYICLDGISAETLRKVKSAIKEIVDDDIEVRTVGSIYKEIAKIEIECTMDAELDEEQIDNLSDEQYRAIVEDLTANLLGECEDTVFQELCDRARSIILDNATTEEERKFTLEYLKSICD